MILSINEPLEVVLQRALQQRKTILLKRIKEALNERKSPSTQIFRKVDQEPEQVGSGFYLHHNERLFLVSAAHVFDDPPENKRWAFDQLGSLQQITGRCYKHKPDGRRDDDLKDLIAIEMSSVSRSDAFASSTTDRSTVFRRGIYGFLGYPGTKNGAIYKTREMKNRPYVYFDMSRKAKENRSFQYDDSLNILIRYQHKKVITDESKPLQGAKMKGISGGPVFWIAPLEHLAKWSKDAMMLAGVIIHTVERHEYMAAARLTILIDVIDGNSQFQHEFEEFDIGAWASTR